MSSDSTGHGAEAAGIYIKTIMLAGCSEYRQGRPTKERKPQGDNQDAVVPNGQYISISREQFHIATTCTYGLLGWQGWFKLGTDG